MHLPILEGLGGTRGFREVVKLWPLPQMAAFAYHRVVGLLYVLRPAAAHRPNAASLADLFRQIGYDERVPREESFRWTARSRFG